MGSSSGYTPETYAADQKARISREMYNDYQLAFQPIENETLTYINDTDKHAEEIADAGVMAGKSFDTIQDTRQRNLGRLGISQSAEVAANLNRDRARDKTLAVIDTKNKMRGVIDQRTTALSEEMIGIGKGIKSDYDKTMSAWTQLEGLQNQQDAQDAAAAAANKNAIIGTGASLVMTAASMY